MTQEKCKWINDYDASFKVFHELMSHRIREILLVLNPYDAFIMEEDASLSSRIINEYRGLNLSHPPRLTRVSTVQEALSIAKIRKFDLVLTPPQVDDMDCCSVGRELKKIDPKLPVVLLVPQYSSYQQLQENINPSEIDRFFVWSADPDLLMAIIKNLEDHLNVNSDTEIAMVRVLLLVEDSPLYKSYFLPRIYKEVVQQTQAVLDESLNEEHRLLKMRARPKILVAENYEEAMQLYHKYLPYVFGVISDTRFPKNGVMNDSAGLHLLSHIRKEIPDLPMLLLSSDESNHEKAEQIPAVFLNKNELDLTESLHDFFLRYLGFGDFVFRMPDGAEITRANNLHEFEISLEKIPDMSLLYHAEHNHFSNWVIARSEIGLASRLHKCQLLNTKDPEKMRKTIAKQVHNLRKWRQQGVVSRFKRDDFDAETNDFVKIGQGSMGGKALGLAFMASQLSKSEELHEKYPDITISIPQTLVITTDGFDSFVEHNNLQDPEDEISDKEIAGIFLRAEMPEWIVMELSAYLKQVDSPLSVRSSSLLEDALYKPYAGLFQTCMIPNNHAEFPIRLYQLIRAVKLIFASAYFAGPRAFSSSVGQTSHRNSMAVIIQRLAGRQYGDYYYTAISGVAQSYNYYPIDSMKPEEGIAHIALGFGKTVVEGEKSLAFSPRHPANLPHFSTVDDILENAQRSFYALKTSGYPDDLNLLESSNLIRRYVEDAETEPPISTMCSTYLPEEHSIRDSYASGVKILTFASILKYKSFPLADILSDLLDIGHRGMGCPIEIEFCVEPGKNKGEFHFLQIRPMAAGSERYEVLISQDEIDRAFCYSTQALGHGKSENISDIIYVKPDTFDPAKTAAIARDIGHMNATLNKHKRPYLLIGPGRWGSADHWLGIPVQWQDISCVKAIIELRTKKLSADASQGTHFFQNITSRGIHYITVTEDVETTTDILNWQWLNNLPVVAETDFIRHVRLKKPFTLKVNGTESTCVIYEKKTRGKGKKRKKR